MSYTTYYDYPTQTTYYNNFFVIKIAQYEDNACKVIDMNVFILYDQTDRLFYVYGSRKSDDYPRHENFVKSFKYIDDMWNFLKVIMNIEQLYVETYVYKLDGISEHADYDEFASATDGMNEISGYSKEKFDKYRFKTYLSAIL